MPSITPNSRTWTLRFKHHKTTILLHAEPIQKLSSIRADLLAALQQTNPSGELNGQKIPQNPDDIILARPADINDLSQGWERLEQKAPFADEANDSDAKGKGKGKAITSTPGSGAGKTKAGAQMKDCPQGAGLRDGSIVAFKFRSEDRELRESEAEDDFVMLDEDREGVEGRDGFDVVVPTIEETYAEEDAAAVEAAAGRGG